MVFVNFCGIFTFYLMCSVAYKRQHNRTVKVEGKAIDVPLSPEAAADSLDGLAKEVYCRTFDWLVEKINKSTNCKKASKGTIDLLVRWKKRK